MINDLKKWIEIYYDAGFSCFPIELKYYENEKGVKKKKMVNPFKWQSGDIKKSLSLNLVENRHNGLAIKTGKKSKFIVLDLDKKDGKICGLDWLKENGVIIPKNAPKVETISGGLHYYFKWTDKLKVKTTKAGIVQGVDIRGEGGIIFAPPTMIGIDEYSFLGKPDFKNIPDMPKELIDAINKTYTNTDDKERKNRQYGAPNSSKYGDVNRCCKFLRNHKLNYDEWIKCGMSLAEMKEDGRNFFFLLSDNEFYNDSDSDINKKFDNFLKTTQKVKIASLFEIAKKYGFKPQYTGYMFTDLDNGKLLADELHETVKWLTDAKVWAIWNGKKNIWELADKTFLFSFAKILSKLVGNVVGDADVKTLHKLIVAARKTSNMENAVKIMKTDSRVSCENSFFDNDKHIIVLQNGVYDLSNFTFKEFTGKPIHHSTKKMNASYKPGIKPLLFNKFMIETFPDDDVRKFVRQYLGYALSGDITVRKMMLFIGSGTNGKSTLVDTIDYVMGGYSDKISNQTFVKTKNADDERLLAKLRGLRLAYSSEGEKSDIIAPSKLKDFTGGEKVIGREYYQSSITFKPQAKLIISANDEPRFDANDRALVNRLLYIFFPNIVPDDKIDFDLPEKLKNESDGILNWMLKGWEDFQAEKLRNVPLTVRGMMEDIVEESNDFLKFDKECIITEKGKKLNATDVYDAFTEWRFTQGYTKKMTQNRFGREFVRIRERRRRNGGNIYIDCRFNFIGKEFLKKSPNQKKNDNDDAKWMGEND